MKRLGIFIIYDPDGIVDQSEEYLLNSLPEIIDRLVVVVNGNITEDSFQTIKKYTNEIIVRPNDGFDGGAYKDVFLHHLTQEDLKDYDELLLLNDTFYGPFYSWRKVFARMSSQQVDFWGLTKHSSFYSKHLHMNVSEHIQSYFIVFRKRLFTDDAFFHFWETMKEASTIDGAIKQFEIPLTIYFSYYGFTYMAYTDIFPQKEYMQREESVFSTNCFDLLNDYHFPILKKKNGMSAVNPQTIPALQYIETHYDYDMKALWDNALRTRKEAKLFETIKAFHDIYKYLYIYGCGQYGNAIKNYCLYNNWEINGYIETNPCKNEKDGIPVVAWRDIRNSNDTGIIVALGIKNTEEVKQAIPVSNNILFLSEYLR